jgi:hypothetical protein
MAVVGIYTPDAYSTAWGSFRGQKENGGILRTPDELRGGQEEGEIEEKYAFECVSFSSNIDFLTGNTMSMAAGEAHALAGLEAWCDRQGGCQATTSRRPRYSFEKGPLFSQRTS